MGLVFFIGAFGLLLGMNVAARRSERLAVTLLFGFGALMGLATAPTISYYASTSPQVLWQAGGATALFIAGFGAFGYATRRDLSSIARFCFWASIALIVFGIVLIFVQIPNGSLIYAILGLVIFAGLTAFDFQRLRRTQDIRTAPLLAASIFLDILNVLLLLSIFGRQDDQALSTFELSDSRYEKEASCLTREQPRKAIRGDARIIEEHHSTAPHGEEQVEGVDDRGDGGCVPPPAATSPPHRLHGVQLHMVDGGGLGDRVSPGRLPVPLVVVDGRMAVFDRLHMPSLDGATGWLNSEPLDPAELRGHVVLVELLDADVHQLAAHGAVRPRWSQAYRDDGLVVIGVHTPEFSFEHEIDRVRRATKERGIDYPVALDNDYAIWSAFDNHYWPALYFVDTDGVIRDHHFGEGRYEQSERVIQRLLGVERELVSVEGHRRGGGGRLGPPAHARDVPRLRAQRALRAHRAAPRSTNAAPTSSPSTCASTTGPSPASGRSGARTSCSTRPAEASPTASTRATRISCSPPERESRSRSACSSTAKPRARRTAWTSTRTGTACSGTAACTSSCASTARSASGRWRSRFLEPGAEAYVFTFG